MRTSQEFRPQSLSVLHSLPVEQIDRQVHPTNARQVPALLILKTTLPLGQVRPLLTTE